MISGISVTSGNKVYIEIYFFKDVTDIPDITDITQISHGYHADITDITDFRPGSQERAPPRHRLIPQDYLRDAPGIHFPCPKVRVFTVLRCDRVLQPKTSKINKTLAGVGRNPHRSASVISQKRSRIHGVAFRNSFYDTQGFNERPKMSRAWLGGAPGTFPDDLGAPRALPVLCREVAGAVLDIQGAHWQCSRPSSRRSGTPGMPRDCLCARLGGPSLQLRLHAPAHGGYKLLPRLCFQRTAQVSTAFNAASVSSMPCWLPKVPTSSSLFAAP